MSLSSPSKNSTTHSTPVVMRDSWGSRVAVVLVTTIAILCMGLLVMDIHMSYKHTFHVEHHTSITDKNLFKMSGPSSGDGSNSVKKPVLNVGDATFSTTTPAATSHNQEKVNFDAAQVVFAKHTVPQQVSLEPALPAYKPKIAYIFAGSARSFVCPQVHWSIKANLIDAMGGEPHVFIRMSLEDNKNTKTGNGVLWKPSYDSTEVDETLKVLNPDILERFSFSNQIEEMKKFYPGEAHTVYRENDQRRYSMFFHRCRAYQLMLRYEKEHNMRFDWVVLARVDAGWLEPSLPIEVYDNDRVWITETGYDRFNDQFMLIPRQYSDYIYDLNTKARQEVYCLGGPDVETWKCNRSELQKRGVAEDIIKRNLPYCCPDIFSPVNAKGRSERIHYKHLEVGKIPLGIGRFPTMLTRRMPNGECVSECFRIYSYHYKEYVFRFRSNIYPYLKPSVWPDSGGRSISARDRNLCYMLKEDVHPWKPITATTFHKMIAGSFVPTKKDLHLPAFQDKAVGLTYADMNHNGSRYHIDYSKPLRDMSQHLHPSILMHPKDTEVWRIHPTWNVEGCLTMDYKTSQVGWTACKGHNMKKSLRYDGSQLFFLYVLPSPPPAITSNALTQHTRSYHAPNWFPDSTYNHNEYLLHNTAPMPNTTRVAMIKSEPVMTDYRFGARCLSADKLKVQAAIVMKPCSKIHNDPLQTFLTVAAESDGSHPMTTIGQLKFAADPSLCVARDDNKKRDLQIWPETNRLYVFQCNWATRYHQNMFEFELIMS